MTLGGTPRGGDNKQKDEVQHWAAEPWVRREHLPGLGPQWQDARYPSWINRDTPFVSAYTKDPGGKAHAQGNPSLRIFVESMLLST